MQGCAQDVSSWIPWILSWHALQRETSSNISSLRQWL